MHRQSPSSKVVKDEQLASRASSSASTLLYGQECNKEEEELKKLNPKTTTPHTFIHLIPILTLLCFLILYLSSYHPSLHDLAEFNGVKDISSSAGGSHERILEIKKGDIQLAIRSLKNFNQHSHEAKHHHRKMAHF